MKILAIDTATEVCSVAVLEDKNVIFEKTLEAVNTHSVSLMPLIKEVLSEGNLSLNDIDLFACDKGPGSFTGIRIGLSTIKAFCDVTNKPCVGVTSLEGFAYKLFDISDKNSYICSLLDAKHGNAYCGIFCFDNGNLVQIQDYCFDSLDNILNSIKSLQKNIFFVGNSGEFLLNMIEFNKNKAWKICEANFTRNNLLDMIKSNKSEAWKICEANFISAVDIGRVAFDKFSVGNYGDSDFLTPLYLKRSSAESKGTN